MPEGRLRGAALAVAEQLCQATSSSAVVDVITRVGLSEIGALRSVLCVVDSGSGHLVPVGAHLLRAERFRQVAGELTLDRALPLTEAARLGVPVWVPSQRDARERYPDLGGAIDAAGAWAALPVRSGTAVAAVLGIVFAEARRFPREERNFVQHLAALAGLALSGQLARSVLPGVAQSASLVPGGVSRVTICAWTRLVEVEGIWLTVEDFLRHHVGIDVTHGIHPDVINDFVAGKDVTVQVPVLPVAVTPIDTATG